jgi:hypothetical protein
MMPAPFKVFIYQKSQSQQIVDQKKKKGKFFVFLLNGSDRHSNHCAADKKNNSVNCTDCNTKFPGSKVKSLAFLKL